MSMASDVSGDTSVTHAAAVEEPRTPPRPGRLETTLATEALSAESPKEGSELGEPSTQRLRLTDVAFSRIVALAVLGVLGLPATALANEHARGLLVGHTPWVMVGYGVLFAVVSFATLAWWSRSRSTAARVAALILVAFPAILIALGNVLFVVDPLWQLNMIRTLLEVILFVTPAVMWWLFLATQRASLLNEFLANLQRMGLLERRESLGETEHARATRIDSYLQKFEATYGRLPQNVHSDVIKDHFRPYSCEQVGVQAPVSVAAVPVSIAVVVLAIGWLITLPPVREIPADSGEVWREALTPNATPVTFAFLGAYFFSIQMLFRRYVRSDLRGSAYVAVVMRIALALIGISVLVEIAKAASWHPTTSLLLGFVVGVFPVVAWQIIRNIMIKVFRYVLPSLEAEMALNCLDGLTVWHEARLEEEDIENVPNMATVDIVSLLISTRLPAERIVDWVDQAILLTYLGPSQARNSDSNSAYHELARHGIRTASALLGTAKSMATRGQLDAFTAMIPDKCGRPVIPSLISSIRTNSNLALVLSWRGMQDETSRSTELVSPI
jgi:hypothetical protein